MKHYFVLLHMYYWFSFYRMLSRQFVHNTQLRTIIRGFTQNSIKRETNKMDKIPTKKSAENIKETDGVIGKK